MDPICYDRSMQFIYHFYTKCCHFCGSSACASNGWSQWRGCTVLLLGKLNNTEIGEQLRGYLDTLHGLPFHNNVIIWYSFAVIECQMTLITSAVFTNRHFCLESAAWGRHSMLKAFRLALSQRVNPTTNKYAQDASTNIITTFILALITGF